jgi:hypothetical protein
MGQNIEFSKSYLKERISFFPWFFIPAVLFFLGHSNTVSFNYILGYSLIWGVFFFRILEDLFSWNYNKEHLNLNYTRSHKTYLIAPMLVCFFLFTSSALMIYPVILNLYIFGVLFLSIISYLALRNSSLIKYICLLMYPLLMYLVSSITDNGNLLWVIIGTIFFTGKYVAKNHFNKINPYMEIAILTSFFVSKYVLNF